MMPKATIHANQPGLAGVIVMHNTIVKTDMSTVQAREFVGFMRGLAPNIKSVADRGGVAIKFGDFSWYVPNNYDPDLPQIESLGKGNIKQCKTIEQAAFECIGKWNELNPNQKFDIPRSLISVAQKFMPNLKAPYNPKSVLKSFKKIKNQLPIRSTLSEVASSTATQDSPKNSTNKPRNGGGAHV